MVLRVEGGLLLLAQQPIDLSRAGPHCHWSGSHLGSGQSITPFSQGCFWPWWLVGPEEVALSQLMGDSQSLQLCAYRWQLEGI